MKKRIATILAILVLAATVIGASVVFFTRPDSDPFSGARLQFNRQNVSITLDVEAMRTTGRQFTADVQITARNMPSGASQIVFVESLATNIATVSIINRDSNITWIRITAVNGGDTQIRVLSGGGHIEEFINVRVLVPARSMALKPGAAFAVSKAIHTTGETYMDFYAGNFDFFATQDNATNIFANQFTVQYSLRDADPRYFRIVGNRLIVSPTPTVVEYIYVTARLANVANAVPIEFRVWVVDPFAPIRLFDTRDNSLSTVPGPRPGDIHVYADLTLNSHDPLKGHRNWVDFRIQATNAVSGQPYGIGQNYGFRFNHNDRIRMLTNFDGATQESFRLQANGITSQTNPSFSELIVYPIVRHGATVIRLNRPEHRNVQARVLLNAEVRNVFRYDNPLFVNGIQNPVDGGTRFCGGEDLQFLFAENSEDNRTRFRLNFAGHDDPVENNTVQNQLNANIKFELCLGLDPLDVSPDPEIVALLARPFTDFFSIMYAAPDGRNRFPLTEFHLGANGEGVPYNGVFYFVLRDDSVDGTTAGRWGERLLTIGSASIVVQSVAQETWPTTVSRFPIGKLNVSFFRTIESMRLVNETGAVIRPSLFPIINPEGGDTNGRLGEFRFDLDIVAHQGHLLERELLDGFEIRWHNRALHENIFEIESWVNCVTAHACTPNNPECRFVLSFSFWIAHDALQGTAGRPHFVNGHSQGNYFFDLVHIPSGKSIPRIQVQPQFMIDSVEPMSLFTSDGGHDFFDDGDGQGLEEFMNPNHIVLREHSQRAGFEWRLANSVVALGGLYGFNVHSRATMVQMWTEIVSINGVAIPARHNGQVSGIVDGQHIALPINVQTVADGRMFFIPGVRVGQFWEGEGIFNVQVRLMAENPNLLISDLREPFSIAVTVVNRLTAAVFQEGIDQTLLKTHDTLHSESGAFNRNPSSLHEVNIELHYALPRATTTVGGFVNTHLIIENANNDRLLGAVSPTWWRESNPNRPDGLRFFDEESDWHYFNMERGTMSMNERQYTIHALNHFTGRPGGNQALPPEPHPSGRINFMFTQTVNVMVEEWNPMANDGAGGWTLQQRTVYIPSATTTISFNVDIIRAPQVQEIQFPAVDTSVASSEFENEVFDMRINSEMNLRARGVGDEFAQNQFNPVYNSALGFDLIVAAPNVDGGFTSIGGPATTNGVNGSWPAGGETVTRYHNNIQWQRVTQPGRQNYTVSVSRRNLDVNSPNYLMMEHVVSIDQTGTIRTGTAQTFGEGFYVSIVSYAMDRVVNGDRRVFQYDRDVTGRPRVSSGAFRAITINVYDNTRVFNIASRQDFLYHFYQEDQSQPGLFHGRNFTGVNTRSGFRYRLVSDIDLSTVNFGRPIEGFDGILMGGSGFVTVNAAGGVGVVNDMRFTIRGFRMTDQTHVVLDQQARFGMFNQLFGTIRDIRFSEVGINVQNLPALVTSVYFGVIATFIEQDVHRRGLVTDVSVEIANIGGANPARHGSGFINLSGNIANFTFGTIAAVNFSENERELTAPYRIVTGGGIQEFVQLRTYGVLTIDVRNANHELAFNVGGIVGRNHGDIDHVGAQGASGFFENDISMTSEISIAIAGNNTRAAHISQDDRAFSLARNLGGIAGFNSGLIRNVSSSGALLNSFRGNTGGLVGHNTDRFLGSPTPIWGAVSTIESSYSKSLISARGAIGGVVGFHESGEVIYNYFDMFLNHNAIRNIDRFWLDEDNRFVDFFRTRGTGESLVHVYAPITILYGGANDFGGTNDYDALSGLNTLRGLSRYPTVIGTLVGRNASEMRSNFTASAFIDFDTAPGTPLPNRLRTITDIAFRSGERDMFRGRPDMDALTFHGDIFVQDERNIIIGGAIGWQEMLVGPESHRDLSRMITYTIVGLDGFGAHTDINEGLRFNVRAEQPAQPKVRETSDIILGHGIGFFEFNPIWGGDTVANYMAGTVPHGIIDPLFPYTAGAMVVHRVNPDSTVTDIRLGSEPGAPYGHVANPPPTAPGAFALWGALSAHPYGQPYNQARFTEAFRTVHMPPAVLGWGWVPAVERPTHIHFLFRDFENRYYQNVGTADAPIWELIPTPPPGPLAPDVIRVQGITDIRDFNTRNNRGGLNFVVPAVENAQMFLHDYIEGVAENIRNATHGGANAGLIPQFPLPRFAPGRFIGYVNSRDSYRVNPAGDMVVTEGTPFMPSGLLYHTAGRLRGGAAPVANRYFLKDIFQENIAITDGNNRITHVEPVGSSNRITFEIRNGWSNTPGVSGNNVASIGTAIHRDTGRREHFIEVRGTGSFELVARSTRTVSVDDTAVGFVRFDVAQGVTEQSVVTGQDGGAFVSLFADAEPPSVTHFAVRRNVIMRVSGIVNNRDWNIRETRKIHTCPGAAGSVCGAHCFYRRFVNPVTGLPQYHRSINRGSGAVPQSFISARIDNYGNQLAESPTHVTYTFTPYITRTTNGNTSDPNGSGIVHIDRWVNVTMPQNITPGSNIPIIITEGRHWCEVSEMYAPLQVTNLTYTYEVKPLQRIIDAFFATGLSDLTLDQNRIEIDGASSAVFTGTFLIDQAIDIARAGQLLSVNFEPTSETDIFTSVINYPSIFGGNLYGGSNTIFRSAPVNEGAYTVWRGMLEPNVPFPVNNVNLHFTMRIRNATPIDEDGLFRYEYTITMRVVSQGYRFMRGDSHEVVPPMLEAMTGQLVVRQHERARWPHPAGRTIMFTAPPLVSRTNVEIHPQEIHSITAQHFSEVTMFNGASIPDTTAPIHGTMAGVDFSRQFTSAGIFNNRPNGFLRFTLHPSFASIFTLGYDIAGNYGNEVTEPHLMMTQYVRLINFQYGQLQGVPLEVRRDTETQFFMPLRGMGSLATFDRSGIIGGQSGFLHEHRDLPDNTAFPFSTFDVSLNMQGLNPFSFDGNIFFRTQLTNPDRAEVGQEFEITWTTDTLISSRNRDNPTFHYTHPLRPRWVRDHVEREERTVIVVQERTGVEFTMPEFNPFGLTTNINLELIGRGTQLRGAPHLQYFGDWDENVLPIATVRTWLQPTGAGRSPGPGAIHLNWALRVPHEGLSEAAYLQLANAAFRISVPYRAYRFNNIVLGDELSPLFHFVWYTIDGIFFARAGAGRAAPILSIVLNTATRTAEDIRIEARKDRFINPGTPLHTFIDVRVDEMNRRLRNDTDRLLWSVTMGGTPIGRQEIHASEMTAQNETISRATNFEFHKGNPHQVTVTCTPELMLAGVPRLHVLGGFTRITQGQGDERDSHLVGAFMPAAAFQFSHQSHVDIRVEIEICDMVSINSLPELAGMRPGGRYILTADIVLEDWQPIPFVAAELDGNNKRIWVRSFNLSNNPMNIGIWTTIPANAMLRNLNIFLNERGPAPFGRTEVNLTAANTNYSDLRSGTLNIGVLAGQNLGIITNVAVLPSWFFVCGRENFEDRNFPVKDHEGLWGHCFHVQPGAEAGGFFREIQARDGWGEFSCKIGDNDPEEVIVDGQVRLIPARGGATVVGFSDITPEGIHSHSVANYLNNYARAMQLFQADSFGTGISDRFNPEEALGTLFVSIDNPALTLNVGGLFGVNHAAGASAGIITNSRVIANIVVGNRLVEETDDPSELPINVRRVVVAGFIGINRGTVIASSFTNGNVENHSRSAFGQGQTDPLLFGNYTAGFIGINSGNARVKANNVSGFDYRRIFDSGTNRQYGVEVEARFDASHDRAWGRIFSVAGDVAGFIFVNGEGGGSPVIEDNVISVKTVGRAIRSGFMHDNVSGLIRRNVVDNHPANRRTLAGQGYSEFMSPHGRFGNSSNNHVTVRTRPNAGITAAPTVPPGGQWSILRHTGEPNINGGFPIADSPGTILSDFIDARVHDRFYGFSMSTIASGIHDNLWMMTVNGPRIVSTEPHNIAVSIRIYSDPVNPEGTRVRAPFLNRSWENFRTGAGTTYRHFVRGEDYAHGSNRNPFIISTGIDFNQVALNTQLLNRIHDQQLGFGEPIDFEGDTVRTSAGGGGGSMRLVNNISLSHQSLGGMELLTPQIILCGGTDETPVYAETDPTRRTTFDGNSLVINDISTSATSALAATRGNLRSVGLFSQINNVVIKNVAFGFIRHGVIANYSIGAHTAVYAGGIAGRAINSKLVDVEVLSSPGGGIWSHVVGGNVTGGLIGYARNTILDTVRARISSASMAGQGEGIRPVTMNETDTAMNASFQRQALNSIGGVIPFGPGISNRADGGPSNTNFRNFFRPNIVYDDNGYYSIGQTGRRFNLSHNAHSISGGLVGILNNDSTEDGIFIRDVRNRADGSLGVFGEIVGGLFGVIKDGRVYNAIVTNTGTKTAKYFVGGIVGVNFGTIDNSGLQGENTISGGVNARAQSPTMLTGGQTASDFLVRRPHVAGTLAPITAGMVAGGVAGYNGGVLKNMTVTASVSNSNFMIAGGVVGRNTNSGEITNVRVTGGGANAGLMAGGLVGYQENDFGFVGVGEGFNLWHHGVPMMQSPANYPSINFQAQPGGIAQPDMVEVHPNLTDAQINQIRAQTLNINNTHRPRNHVITDGFIMQIHDGVHDTGREGFTRTISRFRMYQLNYSARTNASRLGVQNAFAFTVQEWQVRFERERVVAGGGPGAWSIVGTVTIPLRGLSINELVDHIPAALRDTLIGNDAPNRPNMPEGANVDDWNAGFGLTRALRGADLGSAQGNALGHNQVTSDFVSFRTPAGDGHNRVSAMGAGPGTMNTLFFDANVSEDREPEILHGSSTGHMMLPRGRGHVFHSFVDSSRVTVDAQGNFTNNINGFWNPWIGNMGFNINGSSGNNHLHMALARATR